MTENENQKVEDKGNEKGGRVGIDLGTTNSLVAVAADGKTAEILTNRDQETITPSVISLPRQAEAGSYLVGREAVNNARRDPKNTIRSIKRFMGLPFEDPKTKTAIKHVPYEVQKDPGGGPGVVARIGDKLMTPEEVSSQVLRRIREDAEQRLGRPISHAVVTVPAYFLDHQRAATRKAASLAGLSVMALLDEPTAAAIAESGTGTDTDRARILVFDFGGGTLDISQVQRSGKKLMVQSYTGDNFLGGDDIDRAIAGIIINWIVDHGGVIKDDDLKLQITLTQEAEKAKKTLAKGAGEAGVTINGACRTSSGDLLDVDIDITQDDFARAIEPIERRVREVLKTYMEKENLQPEHLTEVLMVGGTSAIERFRKLLQDIFEGDGKTRVRLARSPMEAVAKGAALFAQSINGIVCHGENCGFENTIDAKKCIKCDRDLQSASFSFDDKGIGQVGAKLPRSLGVSYRTGEDRDAYQPILRKGSLYPNKEPVWEDFRVPSLDRFEVRIFAGDELKASQNTPVAIFVVDQGHLPADVKVDDPLKIGFSYTRDRTLLIDIRYPTSKSTQLPRWKVDPPDGRTPEKDPASQLTGVLSQARDFLNQYQEYMDSGVAKVFREDVKKAEDAVLGGDANEIRRLSGVITSAMLQGCGVASALNLAERSIARDDPAMGTAIDETSKELKEQYKVKGSQVETLRSKLERLVVNVLQKKIDHGPEGDILQGPEEIPKR